MGKSMFGIPMVPRVVSGGCGEVTATRTIRYSRKGNFEASIFRPLSTAECRSVREKRKAPSNLGE